ncbi:MAG: lipid-A-disaccharide synthase [Xanthomonadales bacterium]|nr:lipid-A-disaccharide synthase [Gammaproteobacteria bacterium]MBT8054578.1 lipid-A-disaccharide synthase [Gammaproteobacteria bacterium]NND55610.1 lipid-A-disaccharide synthase [Xanthomonadales bacterium]NNK50521.1 lipid-A-disaccharide synthase [Xanthomonadales bacterium]
MNSPGQPTIALVAGEASGDQLGAALIDRLRNRFPDARFAGIGGSNMQAAGMDTWWDAQELAVFGLFEVLSHFPRLLRLRRELFRRLLALSPDVFIGIDAPDFNLGLEKKLRRKAIQTVHYVSPTVWAWREKRVRKIGKAADLVLCLFPFEPDYYRDHGVRATYVGHPMADQIEADHDPVAARIKLGLDPAPVTVALLPGSRESEIERLAAPMIEAARILADQYPGIQFTAAMANDRVRARFQQELDRLQFSDISLFERQPRTVIAAADAVICASGTATLETMLVNRPMVMTYKISPASYQFAKHLKLIRLKRFSLPNILAGEDLVPELIQQDATGVNLASATAKWLNDRESCHRLQQRFASLHEQLRCDASERAAEAVSGLLKT